MKKIRYKKDVIQKLSRGVSTNGSISDPEIMNAHLRRANRMLVKANHDLVEKLGNWQGMVADVAAAVVALPPVKKTFEIPKPSKKTRVVAVLKLSDWHIGEVVDAKEVESFNVFNWSIAQRRMYQILGDFLKWVDVQREAYIIDECALFCEGDYISGDIHYELQVTNEFPLPVQTAKAGRLLGEVFRMVAAHFKTVHVKFVGSDNHGRLQKRPQAKQKTTNNMSFLVHELAQAFASKADNIDYEVAAGMKLLTEVNGVKFLIEHADGIKGWAGIPFYGFSRMLAKEASRRMVNGKGFHYWSTAHFHTPFFLENRHIGNGSLSGTSEFDHSQGRHAKPCQVAFLVHPRHHIFNFVPFIGL